MTGNGNGSRPADSQFEAARREMVERQIRQRGIRSSRVLDAISSVPRHLFVPPHLLANAYRDEPLPIGEGQTISQPFMVAAMAEALSLEGSERVLEVGAGSGYQAALLSLLAREVIAVESQPNLAAAARERLAQLGYSNVRIVEGDGSLGWPSDAPYEAILVTAVRRRMSRRSGLREALWQDHLGADRELPPELRPTSHMKPPPALPPA